MNSSAQSSSLSFFELYGAATLSTIAQMADDDELEQIIEDGLFNDEMAAESRKEREDERDRRQKEHNDKGMFRLTFASTVVAVFAAFGAIWASYEAHVTRITEERPFLVMTMSPTPSPTLPDGKTRTPNDDPFEFRIESVGKTPAVKVTSFCHKTIEDRPSWGDLQTATPEAEISYLVPNRSERVPCAKYQANLNDPQNANYFVVFGQILYQDAGGAKYRTPFCEESLRDSAGKYSHRQCTNANGMPELK